MPTRRVPRHQPTISAANQAVYAKAAAFLSKAAGAVYTAASPHQPALLLPPTAKEADPSPNAAAAALAAIVSAQAEQRAAQRAASLLQQEVSALLEKTARVNTQVDGHMAQAAQLIRLLHPRPPKTPNQSVEVLAAGRLLRILAQQQFALAHLHRVAAGKVRALVGAHRSLAGRRLVEVYDLAPAFGGMAATEKVRAEGYLARADALDQVVKALLAEAKELDAKGRELRGKAEGWGQGRS